MKSIGIIAAALAFAALGIAQAADEKAPATKPAEGKVAATVGQTKITAATVDEVMAGAPKDMTKDQLAQARKRVLDDLIQTELVKAYLKAQPAAPTELAEMKKEMAEGLKAYGMTIEQFMQARGVSEEMLADQAKLKKIQKAAASDEKVEAVVKAKPVACFDGTEVQASHILVLCPLYASEADAAKAKSKLDAVAKEIKDGKTEFAAAAKKNSDCPSSQKGGDLGGFTYGKMVPAFADAAFAMKVGDVGDVVRSSFGFHLIKVTKRTDGDKKVGPDAKPIAKGVLANQVQEQIITASAKANPVTIAEP